MRLVLAALGLALSLAGQAAPSVAFIADVRGSVTIEGNGKLNFLAEIAPGTRLLLGTGASVAITYASSGAEYTLVGPGEFLVSPTEVKAEKGATPKRREVMSLPDPGIVGRLAQSASASLRMRSVAPAATAGRTLLEFPVETRVSSLRPLLRIRADAVSQASLVLLDESGKELWRGPAKPGGTQPGIRLAPGNRYSWTVESPQRGAGEARFETLPSAAIARADKSRAGAKGFPDRVLHAVLLQDIGALQEAREAWAALALERPDLPELAALAR